MSQQQLAVLTKEQAEIVDRINLFHKSEKVAFQDALCYFFLSGVDLLLLREKSTHGNSDPENSFKVLLETYLPDLSKGDAYRRMGLAEKLKKSTVDFSRKHLQLTDGKLPEEVKTPILKEVHEHSDGKTITAVLRDLGIIRPPQKPGTYPRTERDIKGIIEAAGEVDEEACQKWIGGTLLLCDEENTTLGEQKTAILQKMERARLLLGQRIQKILKSRGARSK